MSQSSGAGKFWSVKNFSKQLTAEPGEVIGSCMSALFLHVFRRRLAGEDEFVGGNLTQCQQFWLQHLIEGFLCSLKLLDFMRVKIEEVPVRH